MKKYFEISISYDATAVGNIDIECMLSEEGYDTIEDYLDDNDIYDTLGYMDDKDWYLRRVAPKIFVAEFTDKPDRAYSADEDDYIEYSGHDYIIGDYEIKNEGLEFIQKNKHLGCSFLIEVDDSEEFDPSELIIVAPEIAEYKGVRYRCFGLNGEDDYPFEFYLDGDQINDCEECYTVNLSVFEDDLEF